MSCRSAHALCVSASLGLFMFLHSEAQAQSASTLYGKTYNFVENGNQCVAGGCLGFSEPGRIQVLRGGTVLYFFGNHRGGFHSQGIRLELNRTVGLGGGRVPRGFTFGQLTDVRRSAVPANIQALAPLPFRGGSGTTSFDGRQVTASLAFTFAGSTAQGGNATAQVQLSYVFNVDGATGRLVGGRGSMRASTSGSGAGSFSGNSSISPR